MTGESGDSDSKLGLQIRATPGHARAIGARRPSAVELTVEHREFNRESAYCNRTGATDVHRTAVHPGADSPVPSESPATRELGRVASHARMMPWQKITAEAEHTTRRQQKA